LAQFCEVQTDFVNYLPARFTEKVQGAISRFMHPKTKLFAVELRRILEVIALRGLWRKFWVHFHDLCVQKQSCLPQSSDVFWKFSPCKLYEQSSGRIFPIFASNNEAVCCLVQTYFGSSPHSRFTKKFLGTFLQCLHLKTKLFAAKFRCILEVFTLRGL